MNSEAMYWKKKHDTIQEYVNLMHMGSTDAASEVLKRYESITIPLDVKPAGDLNTMMDSMYKDIDFDVNTIVNDNFWDLTDE